VFGFPGGYLSKLFRGEPKNIGDNGMTDVIEVDMFSDYI